MANPNVAYPRRGKTPKSTSDMGAPMLVQDEQYLTVRKILSEASTPTDGSLSGQCSDFYRFGYGTLGLHSNTVSCCCSSDDLIHFTKHPSTKGPALGCLYGEGSGYKAKTIKEF